MKKINTKMAAVALGAALSVTTLLGGVMLNKTAITASAEEVMPVYTLTVDTPTEKLTYRYGAVQYHYTGDNTDETTYMHFGTNVNPNYGYKTYYGYEYDIAIVPDIGNSATLVPYYWVQAFVENADGVFSSDRIIIGTAAKSSTQTVTGSKVSGTLTTSYTTMTYSATGHSDVYYTCVYDGQTKQGSFSIPDSGETTDATVNVDGLTFTIVIGNGTLKVKTSKTVTCSQTSETDTGYAAFAYTVE